MTLLSSMSAAQKSELQGALNPLGLAAASSLPGSPLAAQVDAARYGQGGARAAITNAPPQNLVRLRKAMGALRAGVTSMKVDFIGDSKTLGYGAGTGTGGLVGAKVNATPAHFVAMMARAGYGTRQGNWGGEGAIGLAALVTYDPRLSFGAGWSFSVDSLGGKMAFSGTSTSPMSLAPSEQFDTLDVYSVRNATSGSFSINVDGGASLATVNAAGTVAVVKTTVLVPRGIHTINIVPNSTGVYIVLIDTSDSTKAEINVANFGVSGITSAGYAKGNTGISWDPLDALIIRSPTIAIIDLGTNDMATGVPVGTFIANETAIANKYLAGGTLPIICVPDQTALVNSSSAVKEDYRQAILTLGQTLGIPVVDFDSYLGTFVVRNTAPTEFYDNIHLLSRGYASKAAVIATLVNSL